ncbi:MAG: hypothetical protein IJY47_04525 [Clostridia bacterium]|nr:hypothetical protein [Clostridia bacterium]
MKTTTAQQGWIRIFSLSVLGMSLISILLCTLSFSLTYDDAIGYYPSDALLPKITAALLVLFALLIVGASFLFRKKIPTLTCSDPVWIRSVSGVVFLGMSGIAVADIFSAASPLTILLGFGGAVYFLLRALGMLRPLPLILSGVCAVLRLTLFLAEVYFNGEVPMNAPLKVYLQLGCLAGMLFLVREMKTTFSPSDSPIAAVAIGLGVWLPGVASVPALISLFSGSFFETEVPHSVYLLLFLWLYAVLRLLSLPISSHPQKTESPSASIEEDVPPAEEKSASESQNPS